MIDVSMWDVHSSPAAPKTLKPLALVPVVVAGVSGTTPDESTAHSRALPPKCGAHLPLNPVSAIKECAMALQGGGIKATVPLPLMSVCRAKSVYS